jgi:hypothetical protein
MTLGIVLLEGPRRGVFLMSEVPLEDIKIESIRKLLARATDTGRSKKHHVYRGTSLVRNRPPP